VLIERNPDWLRRARLGILANQASVDRGYVSVCDAIGKAGGRIRCLFSPQHGFHADRQANMIESSDGWDTDLSVPVFSLYSDVRRPSREMLDQIDVLVVDLQDVGTRVYTYGTTVGLCLEAAEGSDLKVVILDRPNPINGVHTEGNVLARGYESFVGRYRIPMRHGLTLGELARLAALEKRLDIDLEIVAMDGWRREAFYPETGLPWVFPSPNMPTWETALVYPGMVLLEGTNVSEGRGTTLPFQLFGAPFLDQRAFGALLDAAALPGAVFRPVHFEPVFDKWKGELCSGFQIHVTDRWIFRPYLTGLTVLRAFLALHPAEFTWLPPPYEYEFEKLPIDILLGDGRIREALEAGVDVREIEWSWKEGLEDFESLRKELWIYPERS